MRPMFGAAHKAVGQSSISFVSEAAVSAGIRERYGLTKAGQLFVKSLLKFG